MRDKSLNSNVRTTPEGLCRYSKDYFEAFQIISEKIPHGQDWNPNIKLVPVKYQLLAQSLELALKAFLLKRGFTLMQIRQELGHDLDKCLTKAMEKGFSIYNNEEKTIVRTLSLCYAEHQFRYPISGGKTLPFFNEIASLVQKTIEFITLKLQES